MQIPIENIYYLLCYAWNKLDEKERIEVDLAGSKNVLDLLAKVLISGTKLLLKRGIEKDYVEDTYVFPGMKGKLEVAATVKSGVLKNRKTICAFDEFSADVLVNQILIPSLFQLMRFRDLDGKLKGEIKRILFMFPPITTIDLSSRIFKQVRLHRNNRFYGFLMNVCQLIFESSLPADRRGEWKFMDFTRDDRKMNQLFEAFILNFYKRELKDWKVTSDHIKWKFISEHDADQRYIPRMRTDITLQNADDKIIMDAKYYRETMSSYYSTEKIKSENLYQLFSYLLNQRDGSAKARHAKGILIYPTIEKEYDLHYTYDTHSIRIKTVNLNQHWMKIERRLMSLID